MCRSITVFRSSLHALQPLRHRLAPHLSGRRARKIGLRPHHPAAHALKLRQARIGLLHRRRRLFSTPAKREYRAGLRSKCCLHRHHRAGRHAPLLLDGGFEILGMQVQARRGHDDLALATQKAQLAGRRLLRQVARSQPFVGSRLQPAARPRCPGDSRPAHQHLTIRPQLHFAPRQRLAKGPLRHVKRVVQRNQRGRFGHSVALHHHQTHRVPELLDRARQRPAARDDRPELQSHRPVHIAEPPPAQQEGNAGCCTLWTCRALLKSRQCRFDVRLQQRQHAWHGSQHRDALPPYRRNQPRRNQAAFKMQLGAVYGWYP